MNDSLEDIYLTLCGELAAEARVPGVENAFANGSLCEKQCRNLRQAYDRLLLRLGERDEDADVEDIIGCITWECADTRSEKSGCFAKVKA